MGIIYFSSNPLLSFLHRAEPLQYGTIRDIFVSNDVRLLRLGDKYEMYTNMCTSHQSAHNFSDSLSFDTLSIKVFKTRWNSTWKTKQNNKVSLWSEFFCSLCFVVIVSNAMLEQWRKRQYVWTGIVLLNIIGIKSNTSVNEAERRGAERSGAKSLFEVSIFNRTQPILFDLVYLSVKPNAVYLLAFRMTNVKWHIFLYIHSLLIYIQPICGAVVSTVCYFCVC